MLVVDLPPEEADQLVTPLAKHGLDFIALFTPTSDERRIAAIAACASGFAYYVSMAAGFVTSLSAFGAVGVAGAILPLGMTVAITALEFLVAFLQAYVFAVLTCMYLNDALHPGH